MAPPYPIFFVRMMSTSLVMRLWLKHKLRVAVCSSSPLGQVRHRILRNHRFWSLIILLEARYSRFFTFEVLTSPSKHLGLPLIIKHSKTKAFEDIQHRIHQKLSYWKSKLLSQADRSMLIRSVVLAIPMYGMSSFLLPQAFCTQMDTQLRRFWWGYKPNKIQNMSPFVEKKSVG